MSDGYTRVNLRGDVEDQAAKHGHGEILEARFAAGDLGMEKSAVSFQAIKPGKRLPFGHNHDEQEELYVVIRGNGRIKLDDEVVEISELDAVRISPEVMRAVEAGDDGIELLAFGAPKKENVQADVARQEMGWWSD
jgi:mannose-6-phosphate isomerase-like protein (cupin superfamily)